MYPVLVQLQQHIVKAMVVTGLPSNAILADVPKLSAERPAHTNTINSQLHLRVSADRARAHSRNVEVKYTFLHPTCPETRTMGGLGQHVHTEITFSKQPNITEA